MTWYIDPSEIQRDLDTFLLHYNFERTHQGYRVAGRTPARALLDGMTLAGPRQLCAPQPVEVLLT